MSVRPGLPLSRVEPEDLDFVEVLLRGAPELQPFYSRSLLESWLRDGVLYKAVDASGQILGVVHVRKVADAVWLEGIATRPDVRRKGVGRILALQAMEASGGHMFRIMASARNVPSSSLANALGFREIDRVYLTEGREAEAREIAAELGLGEADRSALDGVKGYVDRLAWAPIQYYQGPVYYGKGVALLDTYPPFFALGAAEGLRAFSREPTPESEEFVVYELRRARG